MEKDFLGEVNQDIIEDEAKRSFLVHSLEYRNPFQAEVLKILIASGVVTKENRDKIIEYGKLISDFIGDINNIEIRNLIVEKRFDEAAKIMVDEILKEGSRPLAA